MRPGAWSDWFGSAPFRQRRLLKGLKVACRSETQSEEACSYYIKHAPEQAAYKAIGEVLTLARNFESKHQPTNARLHRMFDAGAAIYAERFGSEWVPF